MLWILSEVYYPEETGTGYYITKIAEYLASRQPVTVLCAQPAYSRAGVKAPHIEIHHGVRIIRCSSVVLHQRSLPIRLIRMLWITISMFFGTLLRAKKDDVILAVTNPPTVPILAALASSIRGVRFSLVVHDVYPEIMAACGLTSSNALLFRLLQRTNKWVLRRAERIFCIGRDMSEHLESVRKTGNRDGIEVIPLWADCHEIQPMPRNNSALLKELGISEKFVVLYAGNMGHPHDIQTLALAIQQLESDTAIHFVFVGSGSKKKILTDMVASGSPNLTVLPPRPRAFQNEFLNACDLAILSLVPGMLGLAVPSRTYNLMAAGKPIIALVPDRSEVSRLVSEERIGWVVKPGSVEETVKALKEARNSRQQLWMMGVRARKAAETKYRPELILHRFASFFEPTLDHKQGMASEMPSG